MPDEVCVVGVTTKADMLVYDYGFGFKVQALPREPRTSKIWVVGQNRVLLVKDRFLLKPEFRTLPIDLLQPRIEAHVEYLLRLKWDAQNPLQHH